MVLPGSPWSLAQRRYGIATGEGPLQGRSNVVECLGEVIYEVLGVFEAG